MKNHPFSYPHSLLFTQQLSVLAYFLQSPKGENRPPQMRRIFALLVGFCKFLIRYELIKLQNPPQQGKYPPAS